MTEELNYKPLPWDSAHFGFPVASIPDGELEENDLSGILEILRTEGTRLVYHSRSQPLRDERMLIRFDGLLADEKVTFAKQLTRESGVETDEHIHPYAESSVSDALLKLALDAGKFSRFRIDPHFRNNEYQSLYRTWIERSVSRDIAHEVIVYESDGQVLGMVTMGEKNHRGDIGLVAVSELARGKGIGKKLMIAAENDFRRRGYLDIQVVTQGINEAACKLYTGSGFHLDEKIYYYHFWL